MKTFTQKEIGKLVKTLEKAAALSDMFHWQAVKPEDKEFHAKQRDVIRDAALRVCASQAEYVAGVKAERTVYNMVVAIPESRK